MLTIPGFVFLKEIYRGNHTLLYKAVREMDKTPVIVKLLKDEYPTTDELVRFKREYELIHELGKEATTDDFGLEAYGNSLAIILEDFGTQSLKDRLSRGPLSIKEFLLIAINITEELGKIHAHYIVHKDINPANILLNEINKQVKIIDFGIASTLPREEPENQNLHVLEGMLPYISPEQTGRMNRGIDYRTDFYSLGVVFYHMLTGKLPFASEDVMEIVHGHIAKIPVSPTDLNDAIPPVISNIVLKLMAKTAEDRYQSAIGIKADLKKCLEKLRQQGKIDFFEIGKKDISTRFRISEKLYGRENERKLLIEAFDKISQSGHAGVVLVTGYAGVGKSRLIKEIHKPIVEKKGYFVSGKFDQYKRDIPYFGIIQVLQGMIQQILTESEEQISVWRQRMIDAVGSNGQVVVDVIPVVTQIIGDQPRLPTLNPVETQNRFNLVFQNFIQALATSNAPLVIFLDDLQWVDSPSLKLLEMLFTNIDSHDFLLIGSYRENEVDLKHPLLDTLSSISKSGIELNKLVLLPLQFSDVQNFLSDTLHVNLEKITSLAEVCFEKTRGNPFFLTQFLQVLYKENLIYFDREACYWTWDVELIQQQGFTDNVIELMVKKVLELPEKTQKLLQLAACLGNRFDLHTLSVISIMSLDEAANLLWPSLEEGLIIPINDAYQAISLEKSHLISYQFLHDRVQQAAYFLINEDEKKIVHLTIARLMLENLSEEKLNEDPMNIVNHFNQGLENIVDLSEKINVAEFNLKAGKRAKSSIAYASAIHYLKIGISLLPRIAWQEHYDLTLSLYEEAMQTAYLMSEFDLMQTYGEIILDNTTSLLDKVNVYLTKMNYLKSQNKLSDAVTLLIKVLRLFGIKVPIKPTKMDVLASLVGTKWALLNKKNEEILKFPEMTDPKWLSVSSILSVGGTIAYLTNQYLLLVLSLNSIKLILKHGISAELTASFVGYAAILCSILNDAKKGYEYGKLALDMVCQINADRQKPQVYIAFYVMVAHFHDHVHEIIPQLITGFQQSLNVGDFDHAGLFLCIYNSLVLVSGKELSAAAKEAETNTRFLLKVRQKTSYQYSLIYWRGILKLLGLSEEEMKKKGAEFDEEVMIKSFIKKNNNEGLYNSNLTNLFVDYFLADRKKAYQSALLATSLGYKIVDGVANSFLYLFSSLAFLGNYGDLSKQEKRERMNYVKVVLKKFKRWSQNAPMNYLDKYYLIEAERCRVLGLNENAALCYDKAIEYARKYGYLDEEAIACELACKFYLEQGKNKIARSYINDAFYTYSKWGAIAKMTLLEKEYPDLSLPADAVRSNISTKAEITSKMITQGAPNEILDLTTLLKATEKISKDIVFSDLLCDLMKIVIENAGAQKGFLLLPKEGTWYIEAEGSMYEEPKVLQSIEQEGIVSISVINYVLRSKTSIVMGDAAHDTLYSKDQYIIQNQPKSVLCMPLISHSEVTGILYLENNLATNVFTKERLELLSLLSGQMVISIDNARLYTDIVNLNNNLSELNKSLVDTNKAYARFVPQEFLNLLGKKSIVDVEVGDQVQKDMTILFSDIRDFTSISEKMSPKENFAFINHFLHYIEPNIAAHQGFVDKYMGDGIMALFPTDADDALQASIAMLRTLEEFNKVRSEQGESPIRIGIGLNSGFLMLGTVGEENRMDGTVISDSVNLASRIESLTKVYGVALLISEDTYSRLQMPSQYHVRKIDIALIRGKAKPIVIYEIFDADLPAAKALKSRTKNDFERAVMFYNTNQFDKALVLFKAIVNLNPADLPAQRYLNWILENKGPTKSFDTKS